MSVELKSESKSKCRICGCTDQEACPEGCEWLAPEICSVCAAFLLELGAYMIACREVTKESLARCHDEVQAMIAQDAAETPTTRGEIWLP